MRYKAGPSEGFEIDCPPRNDEAASERHYAELLASTNHVVCNENPGQSDEFTSGLLSARIIWNNLHTQGGKCAFGQHVVRSLLGHL